MLHFLSARLPYGEASDTRVDSRPQLGRVRIRVQPDKAVYLPGFPLQVRQKTESLLSITDRARVDQQRN